MSTLPALTIARKRDGHALDEREISDFITGYASGEIPDYQMSALAMAIFLRGMSSQETTHLTRAMLNSGRVMQWSAAGAAKVDKHSTGGVGDKVSLVLAPMLACCQLHVPMISGRGLGATGGTLDKLESISGFRTNLSMDEIRRLTESVGCVMAGATEEIAPADQKLYALRDVTATVASIPLITASIMSKKLAEDLSSLILDVKFGSGAFMKTLEDAKSLAQSLVDVGRQMGVNTRALLTDMNEPLGRMIGNAVEVNEAIDVLQGQGPADVVELTIELGAELLVMEGIAADLDGARTTLQRQLESGAAWEKFQQMVTAQGGDLNEPRPIAPASDVVAKQAGFVASIDTEKLGLAIISLGGGRKRITDTIDHSAGLEMLVRIGDQVNAGQPLVRVFAKNGVDYVRGMIEASVSLVGNQAVESPALIAERIS